MGAAIIAQINDAHHAKTYASMGVHNHNENGPEKRWVQSQAAVGTSKKFQYNAITLLGAVRVR